MGPLQRWKPVRAAVAFGVVAGSLAALVAAYAALVWLFNPAAFLVMLIAATAAPLAAFALWRGRWSAGGAGVAQRLAVAVVAGALVVGAALAAVRAAEENRVRALGVPTESALTPWLVLLGGALVALALLVAVAPRWLPRVLAMSLALVGAIGGSGAVAVALAVQESTTCDDVEVDRERWRAARADQRGGTVTDDERIAGAIVECDLLDGLSRREVRAKLGRPDHAGRERWTWVAGEVNDGLGPGDGQELSVRFDDDDRVVRAALLYPPD